jgi:SH3-like domain-containing protein
MKTLIRIGYLGAFLLLVVGVVSVTAQHLDIRECAIVHSATVNLREGPGTDTDVLAKVYQGSEYEVVAHTKNWVKIHHPAVGDGWLYKSLVTIRAETTTVAAATTESQPSATPMHSEASQTSKSWIIAGVLVLLILVMAFAIFASSRQDQHKLLHHNA